MTDDAARERAAKLRDRIARQADEPDEHQADAPAADDSDEGPRPGESPHHYVERRMRDTVKKKEP